MTKRKAISERMKIDALLYRSDLPPLCTCGEFIAPGQPIEWDHVHCVALDGPHTFRNLRPLHKACHKKKTKADLRMIKKARPGHAEKFIVVRKTGEATADDPEAGGEDPATARHRSATAAVVGFHSPATNKKPKRKWPSRKLQSKPFQKRRKAA